MFGTLKKLLRRSKEKEVPEDVLSELKQGDSEPKLQSLHIKLHLGKRARPELVAEVDRLRRKYSELQAALNLLSRSRKGKLPKKTKPFSSSPTKPKLGRKSVIYSSHRASSLPNIKNKQSQVKGGGGGTRPPWQDTLTTTQPRSPLASPPANLRTSIGVPKNPAPLANESSNLSTLKETANVNRMRRLRAWSLQHQMAPSPLEAEISVPLIGTAVDGNAWVETLESETNGSKSGAKLQRQATNAWNILAEIQLESIVKQRDDGALWSKLPSQGIGVDGDPRRQTEPSRTVEGKLPNAERTHSDGDNSGGSGTTSSQLQPSGKRPGPALGRPRNGAAAAYSGAQRLVT